MDNKGAFSLDSTVTEARLVTPEETQHDRITALEAQVRLLWGVLSGVGDLSLYNELRNTMKAEAKRQGVEPMLPEGK
jgi:hypothetical protein